MGHRAFLRAGSMRGIEVTSRRHTALPLHSFTTMTRRKSLMAALDPKKDEAQPGRQLRSQSWDKLRTHVRQVNELDR
eukprot:4439594-Prymnesium_polylepis.1